MPKYYIGIDGGGTKTKFLCTDKQGNKIAEYITEGTYCAQDGINIVLTRLRQGIETCLPNDAEDVGICFGMPAYGENKALDHDATAVISQTFSPMKIRFVNDVVVAWAAATGMNPGVIVVAGTGSISYGKDEFGNWSRCGGWHEFFSDEGSGYWLGIKLLNLFSKQSDGRIPRGALYELVREHFSLTDDFEICEIIKNKISGSRKETAALQPILLKAARHGDPYAAECYEQAVEELTALVLTNIEKLHLWNQESINISYSGGLFGIDDLIRDSFMTKLSSHFSSRKLNFHSPLMSPCEGAVMLAMEMFCPSDLEVFRKKFGLKANFKNNI